MASPHVDYDSVASEFARRRRQTEATLAVWTQELRPYVQKVDLAIDLGAGAGAFSTALLEWGARRVVALEPSAAMQSEAPPAQNVSHLRARGERIPLRTGTAGLVWISAAFHHFQDKKAVATECRRVLADRGQVVLRGFVPGHTALGWLALFPGWEKAVARFPDIDTLNALFAEAGFGLVHAALVEESTQTYGERAEFSARMRHADSILTAMSDADVDAGIAALRSRGDHTIEHFSLSCLVYRPNLPG